MMITLLVGCGETKKTDETKKHVDYTYLYKDILDQYKKSCEADEEVDRDSKNNLSTGLWEVADEKDLLHKVGYKLIDMNDDGVDELLISLLEKKGYYNYIISVYQHLDGQGVKKVEDGWARNKYYLLKGKVLLNEGSGGAFSSEISKLKMIGSNFKPIAMLTQDYEIPKSEDEVRKPFYLYNPNGKTTKKKEFYITKKEWENKINEWEKEIVKKGFIPFADYK